MTKVNLECYAAHYAALDSIYELGKIEPPDYQKISETKKAFCKKFKFPLKKLDSVLRERFQSKSEPHLAAYFQEISPMKEAEALARNQQINRITCYVDFERKAIAYANRKYALHRFGHWVVKTTGIYHPGYRYEIEASKMSDRTENWFEGEPDYTWAWHLDQKSWTVPGEVQKCLDWAIPRYNSKTRRIEPRPINQRS
ncbi:MAG: hypothetical protein WBA77_00685 [Microcoleaceae cyanobacterium]